MKVISYVRARVWYYFLSTIGARNSSFALEHGADRDKFFVDLPAEIVLKKNRRQSFMPSNFKQKTQLIAEKMFPVIWKEVLIQG